MKWIISMPDDWVAGSCDHCPIQLKCDYELQGCVLENTNAKRAFEFNTPETSALDGKYIKLYAVED